MAEPYLGEIRMFAGSFAPVGWALCQGQLLPIGENQALFSLIRNVYGGDGIKTFALPDLRGRVPAHNGGNWALGQKVGASSVILSANQIPAHTHAVMASPQVGTLNTPAQNVPAATTTPAYNSIGSPVLGSATAIAPAGNGQPHENRQPFLCINFIIAVAGIYPSA